MPDGCPPHAATVISQRAKRGGALAGLVRHMAEEFERRTPPYAYLALRALAVLAPPEVAEYAVSGSGPAAAAERRGAARYPVRSTRGQPVSQAA